MRRRALEILRLLVDLTDMPLPDDDVDPEIVREGRQVWLGGMRLANATLDELLMHVAVKDVGEEDKGLERYVLNDVGRAIAADPLLAVEVQHALFSNQPFTIREGRLEALLEEG